MNISDKRFRKRVGLGIKQKIEDIILLLEDGRLLEFLRSNFEKSLKLVNHRYDVII